QLPPARHAAHAAPAAPHRPPPDHRGHRRRRPPAPAPPRGTGGRVRPRHLHRGHDRLQLGQQTHPGRRQGRLVRIRPAEARERLDTRPHRRATPPRGCRPHDLRHPRAGRHGRFTRGSSRVAPHACAVACPAGLPPCATTRLPAGSRWFCASVSCRPSRTASTVTDSEISRKITTYGACSDAPSGPPTAGPTAGASCFTRANAELYCPAIPAGARSATSGASVGDSSASPTPNRAYVEMKAAVAMAWLPLPSPAYAATAHATAQISPTDAITRDRLRRSTKRSTANCAITITRVFAASAVPSADVEMPAASTP